MRDDRDFWVQVRRGLLLVVNAIEARWNLPHTGDPHTLTTLGAKSAAPVTQAPREYEPPR